MCNILLFFRFYTLSVLLHLFIACLLYLNVIKQKYIHLYYLYSVCTIQVLLNKWYWQFPCEYYYSTLLKRYTIPV